MTKTYCDRCGEEIKRRYFISVYKAGTYTTGYELCEKCYASVEKVIKGKK